MQPKLWQHESVCFRERGRVLKRELYGPIDLEFYPPAHITTNTDGLEQHRVFVRNRQFPIWRMVQRRQRIAHPWFG